MNKKLSIIVIALVISIISPICLAINTIQLQHRTANEIIPVIKPLLKPKDQLSGKDYQLFINTDRNTLKRLMPIIKQLDKQLKSLVITVKFANKQNRKQTNLEINPGNNSQNTTIRTRSSDRHLPKVRTIEGKRAFIAIGNTAIKPSKQITRFGNQFIEQDISHLQQAQKGFFATVRLVNENEFKLEIEPQQQSLQATAAINHLSLNTTINGKLGEWIVAGEIDNQKTQENQATTVSGSANRKTIRSSARNVIYIKVEPAN